MATESHIVQLARSILENAETVSEYLSANNLPQPSFSVDGPLGPPVPPTIAGVESARQVILEKSEEIRRLMLGPLEYINRFECNNLLSLQAIAKFRIPMAFTVGEKVPFEHIASIIGLSTDVTKRLLRHALVRDIFIEPEEGFIAHNAVSRALLEKPAFLDLIGLRSELWQASAHTIDALIKYPDSEEPNETGFNLGSNTKTAWFEAIEVEPERHRQFHSVMSMFNELEGNSINHTVKNYPWGELGDGLVVDVGGGNGQFCRAIAASYPQLQFVNQDLASVIARAPKPLDVGDDRVKMMEHDFYQPQPIKNAELYCLRKVLHDWSDKYGMMIIQNLIPALKPGAKVLIVDEVSPSPGTTPAAVERRIRDVDLTMLATCNAKARELDDWKALFAKSDPRFHMGEVRRSPGSILSSIEFIWQP